MVGFTNSNTAPRNPGTRMTYVISLLAHMKGDKKKRNHFSNTFSLTYIAKILTLPRVINRTITGLFSIKLPIKSSNTSLSPDQALSIGSVPACGQWSASTQHSIIAFKAHSPLVFYSASLYKSLVRYYYGRPRFPSSTHLKVYMLQVLNFPGAPLSAQSNWHKQ